MIRGWSGIWVDIGRRQSRGVSMNKEGAETQQLLTEEWKSIHSGEAAVKIGKVHGRPAMLRI
jgi:hypothetical protein